MGGCIALLKAARARCPSIMPPLLLLSAFIVLVCVLGGAPGHSPDNKTKMVSIHSFSELERLKLQETAYHELVARHLLSEFNPNRAVPTDRPNTWENTFLVLGGEEDSDVSSLKTFGIRLVTEFTRRKHLQGTAAMQAEGGSSQASGRRRRRGNVVRRIFGRIRRFFSCTRSEPSLPPEFTRRGRRGAVSVDSLAELEDGALLLQTLRLSRDYFPVGVSVAEIFATEHSAQKVHQLREKFDEGLDVMLGDNQNVHDVAALLKGFFHDMKDSLLPEDLYSSFLLTATLKPQDQLSALQLLVYLLPPCHSDTLERLLRVLHKITEYSEDSIGPDGQLVPGNRMTSTNLALVFGSTLLKKGKSGSRESRKMKLGIDPYVASVNVVRAMIDNWDVLFQVPPHIQRQVAKRMWNSSPEALDFIRRRNLRKIQSARIKMEEDALLSDPVETSAEARAAILGQSSLFDEDQFPVDGHSLSEASDPEGVPDVEEVMNSGENLDYDFEEGPDFEDPQNIDLAEVPYLDVVPNKEDGTEEIPGKKEAQVDSDEIPDNANASGNDGTQGSEEDSNLDEIPAVDEATDSQEPAVPPSTAPSLEDEGGEGKLPIPEQGRPWFRVAWRKKKAKTATGHSFP